MAAFVCPQCGGALNDMVLGERSCQSCGATVRSEMLGEPAAAESSQPSEHFAEFDIGLKPAGLPLPPESTWPEVQIRRSAHGETLALLALLLPLLAQGLALACHLDSWGAGMALSWATIVATALLLAVDAAFLGTIDLRGTQRSSPVGLFFGILLFWIIGYPVAFFRRRHFGRLNLGPLALLVAAFFVTVPFVQQFAAFGVIGGTVPTCTSREVTGMVDDIIRKSPLGPSVQSISGYQEISYDRKSQTRKGQCVVKTQTETITATYTVKVVDRKVGTFVVEVDPIPFLALPSCTSPEVKEMVEDMIRKSPKGQALRSVDQYRETAFDPATKTRTGQCHARTATEEFAVTFQVTLVNDKWFEVKILSGLDQAPMVIQWEPGQQWQPPGQQWQPPGQQWRPPGQPWPQQKQPGQPGWPAWRK
jgi:hypothetical protein